MTTGIIRVNIARPSFGSTDGGAATAISVGIGDVGGLSFGTTPVIGTP
ncbi:hypothetical protein MU0083_003023 [[Mycobacterium] kokjensenii]|uniref:Uncharacterized protein n=1 Tax=[Mycobacterium] kokjensenii TaxID=3064287 RepID=A0ABN9NFQ9_9MYCO|nr:hypothetical protein [Mycolicibacter sp. MU0083]CAJ1502798.1 hypothetical protein MU0083_003023 [Mycolicibacter sp. MU0083]